MQVDVHKIAMASPSDTTGLMALVRDGALDPDEIVAVIGKTEGNGGANDFTRALATMCLSQALAGLTGSDVASVQQKVAFVWSGGCEGVLSPHATIFTRKASAPVAANDQPQDTAPGADPRGRLAIGLGMSPALPPEAVGRMAQVHAVRDATLAALADAGITDPAEVHYVQVKGPLLTPAGIAEAQARGSAPVTDDPNGSKPYARGAMALGVALALGEVDEAQLSDAVIAQDMELYSTVASTSAGGELVKCEVLLFGNAPDAQGEYRIGHAVLGDLVDSDAIRAAIADAGGMPVALFAKAEAAAHIRGRRTTMLSDADIHYERHARAALGAVITAITGDPAIFVSGGSEHQCPPGAAPIAAIARV